MRFFAPLLASMALAVVTTDSANAADTYNAYAGPNYWGLDVYLRASIGPNSYKISYTALGNTKVLGRVRYHGPDGRLISTEFNGEITIRTGKFYSQPIVDFKGLPFGSAVRVTVMR
jgi:hypothetical protein